MCIKHRTCALKIQSPRTTFYDKVFFRSSHLLCPHSWLLLIWLMVHTSSHPQSHFYCKNEWKFVRKTYKGVNKTHNKWQLMSLLGILFLRLQVNCYNEISKEMQVLKWMKTYILSLFQTHRLWFQCSFFSTMVQLQHGKGHIDTTFNPMEHTLEKGVCINNELLKFVKSRGHSYTTAYQKASNFIISLSLRVTMDWNC